MCQGGDSGACPVGGVDEKWDMRSSLAQLGAIGPLARKMELSKPDPFAGRIVEPIEIVRAVAFLSSEGGKRVRPA